MRPKFETVAHYLRTHVTVEGECWAWTGDTDRSKKGYAHPKMTFPYYQGRQARREMYALETYGVLSADVSQLKDHTVAIALDHDGPDTCVNPDHMLVEHKDERAARVQARAEARRVSRADRIEVLDWWEHPYEKGATRTRAWYVRVNMTPQHPAGVREQRAAIEAKHGPIPANAPQNVDTDLFPKRAPKPVVLDDDVDDVDAANARDNAESDNS